MKEQKLNATKHYKFYPDEDNIPPYLAYGFRPILLLLPIYIIIDMIIWSFILSSGKSPFNDPLAWHIYEIVYGVGFAGIMSFIFTGLPELFPGLVPIVGKRLSKLVALWIAGRISFYMIDFIPIFIVAIIHISLSIWLIAWAFKPVVLDRLQRHSSIAYMITIITILQALFFASQAGMVDFLAYDILKLAIGSFVVLTILVLRRVNMEAINERLEYLGIDDVLLSKPFRYNIAAFSVFIYSLTEFFYPELTSTLGWLALASGAGILAIINDYNLEFESLLKEPFAWYLGSIALTISIGYFIMGYGYLADIPLQSDARHIIMIGAFGVAFYVIMSIIAIVHTGRVLMGHWWISAGVIMLIASAFIRASVIIYPDRYSLLVAISAVLYMAPFALYFIKTKDFLLNPRADGIKG